MRVRLRSALDARFAWYYLRSILFQSQVEREKRGMGNMTNIFPSQVERLLIVDCPVERQKEIANEIAASIGEIVLQQEQIQSRRIKISELIEEAITQR